MNLYCIFIELVSNRKTLKMMQIKSTYENTQNLQSVVIKPAYARGGSIRRNASMKPSLNNNGLFEVPVLNEEERALQERAQSQPTQQGFATNANVGKHISG